MKNSLFGLDIGATTMKAVWLSQGNSGYILNAAALSPTPAKGMTSESPLDQQELAAAIKKMLTDVKITTPYVALALPESQVYTRVIDMPVLSDKELTSAIAWEAEQYIPVPLANLTLDHTILKRPKGNEVGTSMQVLLVGAPNNLIEKYNRLLTMAGLLPVVMETEVMAVARALTSSPNFPNALLIHIGAMNTILSIVKDGIIVFTFPVPIGGIAVNRAIATDYGFSFAQAEEYKKVYGVQDKSLGGKIGQTTAPILMAIISEVKKAISYYNEKYKNDSPIKQILLSGGTAKLPGINTFFAQNAGIEAVIANPWNILGTQQVPPQILENATDYTIAVGLAMRTYE